MPARWRRLDNASEFWVYRRVQLKPGRMLGLRRMNNNPTILDMLRSQSRDRLAAWSQEDRKRFRQTLLRSRRKLSFKLCDLRLGPGMPAFPVARGEFDPLCRIV